MLVVESTFLKKKKSAVNIYIFFFSWKTHPKLTLYFSCFPPNMAALSDSEGNGGTEGWENKDGQSVVSHRGVRQTFYLRRGMGEGLMKKFLKVYCLKVDGSEGSSSLWGVSMRTHGLAPSSDQHVWTTEGGKAAKKFTFKIQLVLNYSTTWKQSYSQGE